MKWRELLISGSIFSVLAVESSVANDLHELWSDQYSATGPGHALGRRVAIDALGNIVVLAEEFVGEGKVGLKILKYGPEGSLLWTQDLRDIQVWEVGRFLLAVDGEGAIHVSVDHLPDAVPHSNAPDIRTLLLDPDGRMVWQASFGELETLESVNDMVTDSSGGTIITGSNNGREWITIRYDRNGKLLWTAHLPGLFGGAFSFGWSLTLGDRDEVYVDGQLDSELVTVRYDALGNLQWEAKAGQGFPGSIGRDLSGAVYVGGTLSEGNQNHFAILKYDSLGKRLWTFNGAVGGGDSITLALTVSPGGGASAAAVHADTGFSSAEEILVFSVDAEGNKLWEATGESGFAVDIASDSAGNVMVLGWAPGSGTDFTAIKYSKDGKKLWSKQYDGPGKGDGGLDDFPSDLAVKGDGSVIVVGSAAAADELRDIVTLKYATDGQRTLLLVARGTTNLPSFCRALAVDHEGNTYAVGSAVRPDRRVVLIVQYHPDGKKGWVREVGKPRTSFFASATQVDRNSNLLVCGSTLTSGAPAAVFMLLKIDRNGVLVWQTTHGDPTQGNFLANALALDEAGNAYVTGASYSEQNGFDWTTAKFDSSGKLVWSASEHGGDGDEALALQVDAGGSVYVTGSTGMRDRSSAYHTVRYDADGARLWAASFGEAGLFSRATALAPGPDGGVYVTGSSGRLSIGQPEFATIRYDADGTELWVTRSGGNVAAAQAIVVDAAGAAFVTGSGGLTQKYSQEGALVWEASEPGLDGKAVVLDRSGGAFVAGTFAMESRTDYFVIQYDKDGKTLASAAHAAPASTYYQLEDMIVDQRGDIVLTGSTGTPPQISGFLTVKLRSEESPFHRGDANGDGTLDISDGLCILAFLFDGGDARSCRESSDANNDGKLDCSDSIMILGYLFLGTRPPEEPGPPPAPCGSDPDIPGTLGDLGCAAYDHCVSSNNG